MNRPDPEMFIRGFIISFVLPEERTHAWEAWPSFSDASLAPNMEFWDLVVEPNMRPSSGGRWILPHICFKEG
jgi:hypothetical protein